MLNTNLEFSFDESAESQRTAQQQTQVHFEVKLNPHETKIHLRALDRAKKYLTAEAELLAAILEVDREKIYLQFGLLYLTPYCVQELKLSDDSAASFVRVARKIHEVPELKAAIDEGRLTMTKARTIAPVINPENQAEWINLAASTGKNKLEKVVAQENPTTPKPDKIKAKGNGLHRVELELTDEELAMFRRCQDLTSQRCGGSAKLRDVQVMLMREFLKRHDPVVKAERVMKKASGKEPAWDNKCKNAQAVNSQSKNVPGARNSEEGPKIAKQLKDRSQDRSRKSSVHPNTGNHRVPIPAAEKHIVSLRDRGRCQAKLPDGSKCGETRWTQMHHIVEVAKGGANSADNLTTLCSGHHRLWHS